MCSNYDVVLNNAKKYLGNNVVIKKSSNKGKKFMVLNPNTNKYIHFGATGYEDYTKHKDKERKDRYLARANKIKGRWRDDKYSPNNLAINILWS